MMMTGAQILVEALKREGVEHIFGYAGATICPIADVLRETPSLGYTLVRTEQNAGHMASGYARVTGKTGVCLVTSGPGATNLVTGIATPPRAVPARCSSISRWTFRSRRLRM